MSSISKKQREKIKKRLFKSHNKRKKIRCFYCQRPHRRKTLTLEHILPVNYGGKNSIDNCVLACEQCNLLRNKWVRYVETIMNYRKNFDEKHRLRCENMYWRAMWHATRMLVKYSERLKINFEDAILLLEDLHRQNSE